MDIYWLILEQIKSFTDAYVFLINIGTKDGYVDQVKSSTKTEVCIY